MSPMGSQVATLVGKEVRTLFTSPIAYAVIAVFVVILVTDSPHRLDRRDALSSAVSA